MNFFTTGGIILQSSSMINPALDWLSEKSWEEIKRSANLKPFSDLPKSFTENINEWKDIYESPNPDTTALPLPWEKKLTDFQKLIIIRMIRPDKVIPKVC